MTNFVARTVSVFILACLENVIVNFEDKKKAFLALLQLLKVNHHSVLRFYFRVPEVQYFGRGKNFFQIGLDHKHFFKPSELIINHLCMTEVHIEACNFQ